MNDKVNSEQDFAVAFAFIGNKNSIQQTSSGYLVCALYQGKQKKKFDSYSVIGNWLNYIHSRHRLMKSQIIFEEYLNITGNADNIFS